MIDITGKFYLDHVIQKKNKINSTKQPFSETSEMPFVKIIIIQCLHAADG